MNKKSTIWKICVIVSAITLMLAHFAIPRQNEFECDVDAGISVCVIDDDEDIRRPLDGTDFD